MNGRKWVVVLLVVSALAVPVRGVSAADRPRTERPVVVRVERGGFHWLDAGIGAAGALASLLLVVAVVAAVRESGLAAFLLRENGHNH